jgi:hypothetical protein
MALSVYAGLAASRRLLAATHSNRCLYSSLIQYNISSNHRFACIRHAAAVDVTPLIRSRYLNTMAPVAPDAAAAAPAAASTTAATTTTPPAAAELLPLHHLGKHFTALLAQAKCTQEDLLISIQMLSNSKPNSRLLVQACRSMRFIDSSDKPQAILCIGLIKSAFVELVKMEDLPRHEILDCLASMKHFGNGSGEIKKFISFLAAQLSVSAAESVQHSRHIAGALHGMRNMSSTATEVREVFAALAPILSYHSDSFTAQEVSSAFAGLRNCNSDEEEVCAVLSALAAKLTACTGSMTADYVGKILFTMRHMNSDAPAMDEVLSALVPKMAASPSTGQSPGAYVALISDSLLGLARMDGSVPVVGAVLSSLGGMVAAGSKGKINRKTAATALLHIRNKTPDTDEAQALFAAFPELNRTLAARHQVTAPPQQLQAQYQALYSTRRCSKAELCMITDTVSSAKAKQIVWALSCLRFVDAKANAATTSPQAVECVGAIATAFEKFAKKNGGHPLTASELCDCLTSVKHFDSNSQEIKGLLSFLAAQLVNSEPDAKLLSRHMAGALHGLRHMNSTVYIARNQVREVLAALAPKIDAYKGKFTAQEIANSLVGLRHCNSHVPEVCAMLSVLAVKISSSTDTLSAQHVGNMIFALRDMNSDAPAVCALLAALTPKVTACTEQLMSQHVANALYGIQGMNSDVPEVSALIAALIPKIASCSEQFTSQGVGNSLYGLRGMNSTGGEVRALLAELAKKIPSAESRFTSQCIGNALYGLQNMRSDSEEVCAVLAALAPRIASCRQPFTAQEVISVLYGLRFMGSEVREVRQVLAAMTPKIVSCATLDRRHRSKAVTIVNRMGNQNVPEVRAVLSAILEGASANYMGANKN